MRRIAVLRPHLVGSPTFDLETVTGNRVEGVVLLPVAPDADLRLAISASVREGRVRAEPSALARNLRRWPEIAFERRWVTPGRLLDRTGTPLDPDRDEALLATVRSVFRDRLGGGWSYRLTGDGAVLAALEPASPSDVRLALEPRVQDAAVAALAGAGDRALVAVDPSTGRVVAFAGGRVADRALGATAVPVGSVFKIATAAAALLNGWSPEDLVACPGADVVEGRAVQNANRVDVGEVSLRRAFALSCNTTFARLGAELGAERVRDAAVALGFTGRLAGVEPGRVDDARSSEAVVALSFGASGIEASPVALASVMATLANEGLRRPPTWDQQRTVARRGLPPAVAGDLLDMMRDAVENGTAQRAAAPGADVAAKTGTPQRTVDGGVVEDGLTVAVVRSGGHVLGVAALVLEGGAGGRSAAPLVSEFARRLPAL